MDDDDSSLAAHSGLVACGAVISVVHAHNFLLAYKLGMISRIIMTGVVYQKVRTLHVRTQYTCVFCFNSTALCYTCDSLSVIIYCMTTECL